MSVFACPTVLATATGILLAVCQPVEQARACPPGAARTACVILDNQTGDEILVYVDGVFAGRAHPRQSDRTCVPANRQVDILGRSACDAWGPFTIRVDAGDAATVQFTEQGRRLR